LLRREARKHRAKKWAPVFGNKRCDNKDLERADDSHFALPALADGDDMIVATTENLVGHRIAQTLGQVFGVVVRSRGIGGNFMAGLRSLGGGEIKEYTALIEETRRHAIDRMVANAHAMGADAVVMMRFDSGEIGQTMSEVVAYGTAVRIEPE